MSRPALSLHRVIYDPTLKAFCAEAQILDASGVHRRPCQWPGPISAGFERIARGLRDAATGQQ